MSQHIGPRTVSAQGGSIKRVGNYRIHTFPSELVTDGLVLNLDAGDPRSYPSSGTTWTDLSGNGNNGTLVNGPTYSNADGGSLVFGSPATTKVLVDTPAFGSGSFTISQWFNISTIPTGNYHKLFSGSDYGGGDNIGLGLYLYEDKIRTWVSGGAGNLYYSGSLFSTSVWYNLVISREYGVAWKWYLDGTLIHTYTSGGLTENYNSPVSSIGHNYKWDPKKAARLLLRPQGTSISARTLYNLKIPSKYFSIARCFRPDQIDATHAIEFNQTEGIICDPNITFRDLLGILKTFAIEVAGAEEVRFRPDYYPFTSPSVELSAKHPKLGYIEFGGAGIFRPEVTKPFGIDHPVLAWGLGVERLFMTKFNISDIRSLYSQDLDWLRSEKVSSGMEVDI